MLIVGSNVEVGNRVAVVMRSGDRHKGTVSKLFPCDHCDGPYAITVRRALRGDVILAADDIAGINVTGKG